LLPLVSSFLFDQVSSSQNAPKEYFHMANPSPLRRISLDTWAVLLAFAAALVVRFGILKSVPW
jgi:hypothetical protein